MVHRRIIHSMIWWLLWFPACFPAQRLLPSQYAPSFTRGSERLISITPFVRVPSTVARPAFSTNVVNRDVDKQESVIFNNVNGKLIQVVNGHYAYISPEGIPVSIYYIVDDNGYRASFKLGTAVTGYQPLEKPVPVDRPYPVHPNIIRSG
ncbi:PREDICTED: uncharacterized protein LOC106748985 [Dinoponera quadriceps]|uniref:Uncharacterized protein LOC106748985 n=1 Tax=Dinoponera quadriceps TaxID=609295 RepID=A0A6P3XZE3_DINQU|nr:PREDICTED: uncharacterized protein LOC106748985 [Dinoponera quadriceps]